MKSFGKAPQEKAAKAAVRKNIGKAFDIDETESLTAKDFIGGFCFSSNEQFCLIARPFSADAVVVEANSICKEHDEGAETRRHIAVSSAAAAMQIPQRHRRAGSPVAV